MKLSITLPSLYPEALRRALDDLAATTRHDHEIIVCAPFRPAADRRVVWVPEARPLGSSGAQAAALGHMTGDFVVALSDDRIVEPAWDLAAIDNFRRREAAFRSAGGAGPFCLGLRHRDVGHVGTVFGIHYPAFPLLRRTDVERHGWYDPVYFSGWGDVDLGLRVWDAGGRCEWSEAGLLAIHPDDRGRGQIVDLDDMPKFLARWVPRYGTGWQTGRMQDFNIDVDPNEIGELAAGNTIHCNEPAFAVAAASASPPRLIGAVNGHNLVAYRRKVFAVPRALGPFALEEGDNAAHPALKTYADAGAAERSLAP